MKQNIITFKIHVHIVDFVIMFIIDTILDYIYIELSFLALFKRCPSLILYEILVLVLIASIGLSIASAVLIAF